MFLSLILFTAFSAGAAEPPDRTVFGYAPDPYGPKVGALTFTTSFGTYLHGRGQYLGSGGTRLNDIWNLGLRVGYALHENAELELSFGYTPTQTLNSEENVYFLLLDGLGQLPVNDWFVPYLVLGLGAARYDTYFTGGNSFTKFAVDYGIGAKFFVAKNLAVRPDVRALSTFGNAQTAVVATLNFTYYAFFGKYVPKDRDHDGIPDFRDKCPEQVESLNGFQDDDGCPDELLDRDKDGIPDVRDECPEQPETFNSYQDDDGCADELPDRDKDGIPDIRDKCADQPETFNNYLDEDGCPDELADQDKDGIPDAKDQCPTEPETTNGFRDDDGCPDSEIELVEGTMQGVMFEFGKATLRKQALPVLDAAAGVMKKYPELEVRIEGHTDNVGSPANNQILSEKRAEAVKNYLIAGGVAAERMATAGFGESRPIEDNKTAKGRAKNRRIEFHITKPLPSPKV